MGIFTSRHRHSARSAKKLRSGRLMRVTAFMAAAVAAFAVYVTAVKESDVPEEAPVGVPISCITQESGVFTVIAVLDGSESEKTLSLFAEICRGFEIKAVVFAETGALKEREKLFSSLTGGGHTVGLLCRSTGEMTRSAFMKHLANRNDAFYSATGRYPKYCFIEGTPCRYAAEVINAYGQYYISYAVLISGGAKITDGCVAAANLSDASEVYALAGALAQASSDGLRAVDMKEFTQKYESYIES